MFGVVISADYAVVDVREGGPDGMHIIIPVPLALARVALSFAPEDAQYVPCPEISTYIADIQRAVGELHAARDGVLVSVEERDETVLIRKVGENVEIDVDGNGEEVHVTIPLDAVVEMLDQYDGEGFYTKDLISSIGEVHGEVVHVRDGDEEVKVWIW
jgi:hypothetical protein